ncbi:MAG TPA: ACT domain-containing protein [Anaerolineae bacterium]|nr:ACT domain-containing protein [Anaerolineae bacterium]
MAKDLTVIMEDRPGTLADMGEVLGNAGINIEGMCATTNKGEGVIHILVEDSAGTRKALEAKGVKVSAEREVVVVDIEDRAGALGEIARKLANAGVNVELVYLATKTRLVIGVDDLEKARSAI